MEITIHKNPDRKCRVWFLNSVVIEIKKFQRIHSHQVNLFILYRQVFEYNHSAEQATIDQQQHTPTPRVPSSPQPQLSPQIRTYVSQFSWKRIEGDENVLS